MSRDRVMALALAGLLALGQDHPANREVVRRDPEPDPPPPKPPREPLQYPYYNVDDSMRPSPTAFTSRPAPIGEQQGERVAAQVAKAKRDPFEASNKCLERIRAKTQSQQGGG